MNKVILIFRSIALSCLLTLPAVSNAVVGESEGKKEWVSPDEVRLPPVGQRKIIGTWLNRAFRVTRSFEQVGSQYFEVVRGSDGSGGDTGKVILKTGNNKFKKKDSGRNGDYFVIEKDGSLGVYDKDGHIDTLPKHAVLFPTQASIAAAGSPVGKQEIQDTPERTAKIKSQFSSWDGAHKGLEKIIKDSMNDPRSYEHVESKYIDMKTYLIVTLTFRGKNAFGALVKNSASAKVTIDGNVVEIIK